MRHPHVLWRLLFKLVPWRWFRPTTRNVRTVVPAVRRPQRVADWRGPLSQRELKTKTRNRVRDQIQKDSRRRNRKVC